MDFQRDEGLEVDGEYGEKSHAASWTLSPTRKPGTKMTTTKLIRHRAEAAGVTVAITGGSVYVRVGNGTNYRIITTVKAGMTFDHVATARNGWNASSSTGRSAGCPGNTRGWSDEA